MAEVPRFEKGAIIVPREKAADWKKWGLRVDKQDPDGTIHAAPIGGGFIYRFPPARIRHHDFIAVPPQGRKAWDPETPMKPSWYKTQFHAEWLEKWFEGWTDGTLWNGWGTPHFEFKEAMRYAKASQRAAKKGDGYVLATKYDPEQDAFVTDEGGEGDPEEFSVVKAETITVGRKRIKVYPIGSWSWTWSEGEIEEE